MRLLLELLYSSLYCTNLVNIHGMIGGKEPIERKLILLKKELEEIGSAPQFHPCIIGPMRISPESRLGMFFTLCIKSRGEILSGLRRVKRMFSLVVRDSSSQICVCKSSERNCVDVDVSYQC